MKHIAFLIIIGLSVVGCSTKNPIDIVDSNQLEQLDYVVISAALDQYFFHPTSLSHRFGSSYDSLARKDRAIKRNDIKELLVNDSTWFERDTVLDYVHQLHSEVDTNDFKLTERINVVNHSSYKIDSSLISSFEVEIINKYELDGLLDSIIYYGTEKLYNKYPSAYGIVSFSKPAYNDMRDRSIIYISFWKGPKSAKGSYLWLKKEGESWIVYDLVTVWVS